MLPVVLNVDGEDDSAFPLLGVETDGCGRTVYWYFTPYTDELIQGIWSHERALQMDRPQQGIDEGDDVIPRSGFNEFLRSSGIVPLREAVEEDVAEAVEARLVQDCMFGPPAVSDGWWQKFVWRLPRWMRARARARSSDGGRAEEAARPLLLQGPGGDVALLRGIGGGQLVRIGAVLAWKGGPGGGWLCDAVVRDVDGMGNLSIADEAISAQHLDPADCSAALHLEALQKDAELLRIFSNAFPELSGRRRKAQQLSASDLETILRAGQVREVRKRGSLSEGSENRLALHPRRASLPPCSTTTSP